MMLLLKHDKDGSKANARCLARMGLCEGVLLPLHIAIAVTANQPIFADWEDKNGLSDAFKLICRLCAPIMRHRLEIVRMLAQKTKGIEKEAYIYAMEGKVVEFVILLMVASEKVLITPLSLENKNDMGRTLTETVLSLISNVVASLVLLQQNVSSDDDTAIEIQKCMEKKAKLEQILVFIRIFETIGNRLCEYLQLEQSKPSFVEVTQHVGRIFEEGGIHSRPDVVEEDPMKKKYCWHGFFFPQRKLHGDFVRNALMTRPFLLDRQKCEASLCSIRGLSFATAVRDVRPIKPAVMHAKKCVPQVCDHKFAKLFWGTLSRALKHA
ncbi:unnamed protein product [Cuscuta campestris]|uniref:Uncharacterized protein n=1 Tax=Cuscuta campestris TaxID=132261 RepID=A0A484M7I8_9ASTE|nr:unnamed protein product [Cuscuta campestris]